MSAFTAAARSCAVLIGEFAGTTITWISSVRRAIGVTCSSVTGDFVHGERADHDEAVHHQLVAVALGAVDELRDADAAAGACHVRHLDAAGDLGGDQRLLHRACGLIPTAAGCGGRHDLELELLREGRCCGLQASARRTAPNRRV
jgi:hypothetical protein